MKYLIALIAAMFATVAFAAEPAYWMKSYPAADNAKVQRCLAVAEQAYEKNLKGGMDGVFWAVFHKGNEWEACMEGK